MTVLLLFQFGLEFEFLFFPFVHWLLWQGLPKLYWIIEVRVDILVLFLILEEIQFFTIENNVCSEFVIYGLYYVEVSSLMVNKRVRNAVLGCNLKNDRMISVHFQGKPFNIILIQVYAPTSNSEEAEDERFYEDLQDLLELTPQKDVLFIVGDWNAKVGSQETPVVTGKFGLRIWNEAGQRLIEFCQENALVITNTLFQQHKRRLYTWTSLDAQHRNQIDYILCSQRWRSSIQSAKTRPGADCGSDHELLMLNSDWNWRKWGKLLDHSGMT